MQLNPILDFGRHKHFEEIHKTSHELWRIYIVDASHSQWRCFLKPENLVFSRNRILNNT